MSRVTKRGRVHTLAMPIVNELSDMFKAADGPAIAALMGKMHLQRALEARPSLRIAPSRLALLAHPCSLCVVGSGELNIQHRVEQDSLNCAVVASSFVHG
jgi:hypothetical protein